jgi:hypothetical protein
MAEQNNDEDQMKILFPTGIGPGECTVLVQINPEDALTLDFTGATGAIGRLEADDTGGTSRDHVVIFRASRNNPDSIFFLVQSVLISRECNTKEHSSRPRRLWFFLL